MRVGLGGGLLTATYADFGRYPSGNACAQGQALEKILSQLQRDID
jgi:hypothetical protein